MASQTLSQTYGNRRNIKLTFFNHLLKLKNFPIANKDAPMFTILALTEELENILAKP